jgi:hypothetical protein
MKVMKVMSTRAGYVSFNRDNFPSNDGDGGEILSDQDNDADSVTSKDRWSDESQIINIDSKGSANNSDNEDGGEIHTKALLTNLCRIQQSGSRLTETSF